MNMNRFNEKLEDKKYIATIIPRHQAVLSRTVGDGRNVIIDYLDHHSLSIFLQIRGSGEPQVYYLSDLNLLQSV
jgi:hypothetical protein